MFWPTIQHVPLKMPGQFKGLQDNFEAGFHKAKPDKKLKWVPQLGAVSLTLELEDRTVEVEATPIQAGVIELFSEQDTWHVEQLMERLGGLERILIQSALDFWIDEGVLKNEDDAYKLLERAEVSTGVTRPRTVIAEEQAPVDEKEKQQAEQMKIYWQVRRLNFGSLNIV